MYWAVTIITLRLVSVVSFAVRYDILFPKKRRDQRGDDHAEIRQGAAGQRL